MSHASPRTRVGPSGRCRAAGSGCGSADVAATSPPCPCPPCLAGGRKRNRTGSEDSKSEDDDDRKPKKGAAAPAEKPPRNKPGDKVAIKASDAARKKLYVLKLAKLLAEDMRVHPERYVRRSCK